MDVHLLNDDDVRRMHARAIAGALMDIGENLFGDARVAAQSETYDLLADTFPTLEIHISAEDGHEGSPYVEVAHPNGVRARNYGGGTVNLFDPDGVEFDVVTRTRPTRNQIPWDADGLYAAASDALQLV